MNEQIEQLKADKAALEVAQIVMRKHGGGEMRILNLGAGIQSTALALMAESGEIAKFDYAIFADVQAEPESVYSHLEWLIKQLSYPVLIRSRGSLLENLKNGVNADGQRYCSIPAFTGDYGRLGGITRRQCTSEYKIKVVEKTIRQDILNLPRFGRIPKDIKIVQSFGLSYDEQARVVKVQRNHSHKNWAVEFPLYDMEMTRSDCVKWLENYGIPHTVPRSACTFCPYHSDAEWKRMKLEDSESWDQAVEVDRIIRDKRMRCNQGMNDQMWLHRSCKPLDEIDFDKSSKDAKGQSFFSFTSECEGMCGV